MRNVVRDTDFPPRRIRLGNKPAGFTLVELLVVMALTLIMMTLFASIFQITGNFVSRQKGIAENDQSARILTTALQTDLQARTMRYLAPFHPNMSALGDDDQNRQGYFYYSENNPADDTDDVVQFTVNLNKLPTTNPLLGGELYGLATFLALPWQANTTYPPWVLVRPVSAGTATGFVYKNDTGANLTSGAAEPAWNATVGGATPDGGANWTTLLSPINQPDGDDGTIAYDLSLNRTVNPAGGSPNNTGASQYAEISYFLRHGNLYRRVLLIRDPYDNTGNTTSSQPYDTDAAPALIIPGLYPPYPPSTGTSNFWSDFDYSARIQPPDTTGGVTGVNFHGTTTNEGSLTNLIPGGSTPLGRPDNRFGFDQIYVTTGAAQTTNGVPREFDSNALPAVNNGFPIFFGRYTHEETSNTLFQFPGNLAQIAGVAASPMGWNSPITLDQTNFTMSFGNTANPPIVPLAGGARRGEDILLTNVLSFDVKIWDQHYSEAADDVNRNGVLDSGPAFADVGHLGNSGDFQQSKNIFPVYGPHVLSGGYAVPGGGIWAPAFANPSNGGGIYAYGNANYNYNNVFDTWYRQFNYDNLSRTYDASNTNVWAPAPYRPRIGNTWQPNTLYTAGTLVDPGNIANGGDTANGYVYLCTTTGTTGAAEPFSLSDTPGPGTIADGTAQWRAQPPLGVQAIQITVKYLDPTQNLLRQVTIVQSLTL